MKTFYTLEHTVTTSDIDDLNHVNNVTYVKWMEEIASRHWSFLTKENPLPKYIWVVLKHEINYYRQAHLGDEIVIKTWVGESKSFKSERFIAFYLDDKLLVKSTTIWGLLDAKTYKPTRITEKVLNVLQPSK